MPTLTEPKKSRGSVAWLLVLPSCKSEPFMVQSVHVITRRQLARFVEHVLRNFALSVKQIALLLF